MYSWGVRFTLTVKFDMEVDTTIEKEKLTEVSQISSESFRKIQKLLNFRDAARPTEILTIPGRQSNGTEILKIPASRLPFSEIPNLR